MKKLFFIVLFGIMALFMIKVYAEESIPLYEEFNNVFIKFENSVDWKVPLFSPYLVNGKMFLDVDYEYCAGYINYDEDKVKCGGDYFLSSIDNLDNSDKSAFYRCFVIDNYFYTYDVDIVDNYRDIYIMTKYDENFNQVGQVNLQPENDYFYYPDGTVFIKNVNNEIIFIDLYDLRSDTCRYALFDNEFTTVTEKPCDDTIFPAVINNYPNRDYMEINSNKYDMLEDKVVFIDEKKLYYYKDNKLVFEKDAETENAHFFKVRFLDKYIVVAEDHTHFGEKCEGWVLEAPGEDCVHYSKLLFYDEDGNLVKTMDDNNNIYDFNVDREYNKLVMTNVDYDGICTLNSYAWVATCVPTLRYSMYAYEQEPEKTPDKPNEVVVNEPNPNTNDFVIIISTILCISIILLINARHRKKELED